MPSKISSFHQIGNFIYLFQITERQIDEIILLLANADDEMIRIMITELDFSAKLKTVDVMLARFIDVRNGIAKEERSEFHKLISKVIKLCQRRNDIVHSTYRSWLNVEGEIGLLRQNSKLRSGKGIRERTEEELLPEAFTEDLTNINSIMNALECYRLKIIDWLYPDAEI